ncbi:hypothetical protein RFI_18801, partial [Reticulomyxa filosa]
DDACNRGFLAFFIVDPKKPIFSYRDTPTFIREHYITTIDHTLESIIGNSDDNKSVQYTEIAMEICEFAGLGYRLKEAKKFRQESIALKSNNKSQWGTTHYGNSGETKFYPNTFLTDDHDTQFEVSTDSAPGTSQKIELE